MDATEHALAIYEAICTTSADRPFAFRSAEQMHRDIAAWQASNPGLADLRQAPPEVHIEFLRQSVEWLKAVSQEHSNFRVTSTLLDAILYSLQAAPKPLAPELVLKLLTDLRESSVMRFYFPLYQFLSVLTREQITDEIRAELRKLHLQYAPSPTGKMDQRTEKMRNRLAELMHVEGEKELEPGRGPWSQIVFEEIAAKDDITRSAWLGLLEHCRALEPTVPGAKWKERSNELIEALGATEVWANLQRWLALGPTPGQPAEARSPIEDSSFQKGAVWLVALGQRPEMASAIGDFAMACLRKVPMLGAVSQKVGFACVQALGSMECNESISQLARLRTKIKYSVAQRLIEKSLQQAAKRSGLTVEEVEDFAVAHYSLDGEGRTDVAVGDARATVQLSPEGHATVIWRNANGEAVKSAPSHVKKAFGKEAKRVSALAKELEQAYLAQRYRLESSFVHPRIIPAAHWRRYFVEHPLLGLLGRRLIWVFSNEEGWEDSGLHCGGEVRGSRGDIVDVDRATKVRLWHPLSSEASEIQAWRERIFASGVRQPFRQAFREFYEVTEEERHGKTYSNRFAGMLMRQHQFASLCRAKGWNYRLMGSGFDGFNVPTKLLAPWNMHAEFYVDLPSDRKPSLAESALNEQSHLGINRFLGSDQVRFYRERREIAVEDVPAVVYSEVMRDVDLFTSVSAVGPDETWSDQGDRGTGVISSRGTHDEFAGVLALRIEILSRVLPLTRIAGQCRIEKSWLLVQGQLGSYRIQIAWDSVARVTDSGFRRLNIPPELLEGVSVDFAALPIELDHRAQTILRKAHLLADDWKINSPDLIRQLM
ncbi:MAG TPA: DUF4132 domain-containing protein [Candidatus Acidoferrales bacterium]